MKWYRYGDASRKAPTTEERFWSKVEKTDTCWNWTASKDQHGYGRFNDGQKVVKAYRWSYERHVGAIPDGLVIDHLCHNPQCVRPHHLRAVTQKENAENRRGAAANNVNSGVRGVYRSGSRWQVRVGHGGRHLYFGSYSSIEEAERVATRARENLHSPVPPI